MANPTTMMKDAGKEARQDAADLEARVEKLSNQLAELTKSVSGYSNGTIETLSQEARRMKNELADRSMAMATTAKDTLSSAEGDLERRVREHPLTAIGVAAGIGFLAAVLTKR